MTRLLLAAAATALIAGAAHAQDRDVPVGSFDRLEAGGQFDLFVTYGDTPSLRLSGDAAKFDDVIIEMRGDKLEISQRRPNWFRSPRPIDVDVHLVAVRIEEAEFSTGIDAVVEGVDEDVVDFEVNTGARAAISGSCGTADYAISTGGELNARNLICARIDVSSSTGGMADVHASEESDARASTGASVRVYGGPERWRERESLGGSVRYVRGERVAGGE